MPSPATLNPESSTDLWDQKDLYTFFFLCILAYLAYSNSFHGEFQYDDERLIRFNFALRDLSQWKHIFHFELFRPLTLFSYALNFQISGKDPWSYHVCNFALHLITTGLFYLLARRMKGTIAVCFFTAALFSVHPLNTEAVSYIASRPILLCAVFYFSALLSFDCFLRRKSPWGIAGFFLFFLLGLASKEEAMLLPAATLLYHYYQLGPESTRKLVWFHGFNFAIITILLAVRFTFLIQSENPHAVLTYFATETSVWFRYLYLAIFPISLNVDHQVSALDLTSPLFWLSLAMATALIVLLFKIRKRNAWISFFGIWFFLNLMASSSFVPLNDFLAEHRAYLSMAGFCACVASAIRIKRNGSRLVIASLVFLLIFYSVRTWKRNVDWQTNLDLWADAASKSPNKFRPHLNLAYALFQRGAYQEAAGQYSEARELNPNEPRIHTGLGFTYIEMKEPELAELSLNAALHLDPEYIDAKTGIGILRYHEAKYEQALSYLMQSYPHRKESAELIAMICDSYLALNDSQNALRILREQTTQESRFENVLQFVERKEFAQARKLLTGMIAGKR